MNETNRPRLEVTIEKLVYGGEGLARVDGQVLLTPRVAPAERVRVEVVGVKAQLLKAIPVEILESSPQRRAAPCPHFGKCGGCHYQHLEHAAQVEQKVAILREVFQRVGKFAAPESIPVITGPEFEYRNRTQIHFDGTRAGFHEADSNRLHSVDSCQICSPKLNEALAALRRMAGQPGFPGFLRNVELFTNETDVQVNVLASDRPVARHFFEKCARDIPGFVDGALHYEAAGLRFRVNANSFFQVNRFLIAPLVEAALEGARGDRAIDLYAGVGLFSIPMAQRFADTSAVETIQAVWRDLVFNAEGAGVGLNAVRSSAEQFLADAAPGADFVLADPPRAGMGKDVVRRLIELEPKRIHVVSCDSATLARDLAKLLVRYEIESMTVIDLFPQTYHIETIVRLRLR